MTSVSLYIANTKISGFQLEVTCHDPNQVVVGIRVLLGCQDVGRIPSYIEVLGRTLSIAGNPTPITKWRWFEFPLTRDESLQAGSDKKVTITFGQSLDPGGVNIVDSVQLYGKTKEAFGWPDDHESEMCSGMGGGAPSTSGTGAGYDQQTLLLFFGLFWESNI